MREVVFVYITKQPNQVDLDLARDVENQPVHLFSLWFYLGVRHCHSGSLE